MNHAFIASRTRMQSALFALRPRDYEKVLRVAQEAAYKAGKIMRNTSGNIEILNYKENNPRDIVTESDFKCQEVIKQTIEECFPGDAFLGEEDSVSSSTFNTSTTEAAKVALSNALNPTKSTNSSSVEEELLWIVDPIDGTTNFQCGLPMFCVSIGVVSKDSGQVVVGVIYNPILDEMIHAVRDHGCYVNGKKLAVGEVNDSRDIDSAKHTRLKDALVNVGFPGARESTLVVASRAIRALATKTKGLRMIACASQVLSWVAQNKINAYVSWDLNSWDICAGMLIVEEAGGFISDLLGNVATIESRDLIISCYSSNQGNYHMSDSQTISSGVEKSLHYELLQVLTENQCISYDK